MNLMQYKLLDTTLRDGSYSNNFSFTKEDTISICKAPEDQVVDMIEIGYGVGLNASKKISPAIETDESYLYD